MLRIFVRKAIARIRKCLRALFGIEFGHGILPNLSPFMACKTFDELDNVCSFAASLPDVSLLNQDY